MFCPKGINLPQNVCVITGADLDIEANYGGTALDAAQFHRYMDIVTMLQESGIPYMNIEPLLLLKS